MDPAQQPRPADPGARSAEPASGGDSGDSVLGALRAVSLFEGLDEGDLTRIRNICEPLTLEAGETLFQEGERGDTFFVIVDGSIELGKASSKGSQKLAVLRAGQAFGEMALLNRTPRSATATAVEPTSLLTVSHDAFVSFLGGDSVALRIMRSLSKALWATSVRLTAKQTMGNEARAAVGELNRVVRGQLTARQVPRVPGYDVAAKASFNQKSRGAATWDTFVLVDGRPVLALLKAEGAGMLHAQNLVVARALMRDAAARPHADLAAFMNGLNGSLRRVAVSGLSHPVTATLVALSPDGIEWGSAGKALGLLRTAAGEVTPVEADAPALGAGDDHVYRSERRALEAGDAFVAFAEGGSHVLGKAAAVLARGAGASAAALVGDVVDEVTASDAGMEGVFDTVVVLAVGTAEGGPGQVGLSAPEVATEPAPQSPPGTGEGGPAAGQGSGGTDQEEPDTVIEEGFVLEVEDPEE